MLADSARLLPQEDNKLLAQMMAEAAEGGDSGAVQLIEPPVDPVLLGQLLVSGVRMRTGVDEWADGMGWLLLVDCQEFGFAELHAKKALLSGASSVDAAIQWIQDHQEDADIEEPIALVPQVPRPMRF
jgi:hypothetical protein